MRVVVDLLHVMGRAAKAVGGSVRGVFLLVRDGEDDVRETYPELQQSSGEQAAVGGSLFMGSVGVGH